MNSILFGSRKAMKVGYYIKYSKKNNSNKYKVQKSIGSLDKNKSRK